MKKSIKNKIQAIEITMGTLIIILLGIFTLISVINIRQNASDNLRSLDEEATRDATGALRSQMQDSIQDLAENRSALADSVIERMYYQTRQVALAAEDIFSNGERYIEGVDVKELPVDTYDFACNLPEEKLGKFSIHIRAPREVMAEDSVVEKDGVVTAAKLDVAKLDETMRRELYLAGYLDGALGGLRNYDNGDGTFKGIAASYFCIQSSGIDMLADTQTQQMIEYDARESKWYKEAAKLGPGEVYWTNPVPDASGRGLAIICAMPVYVNGRLVGVAGSGGGLDSIKNMVQSTTVGFEGYAFLVNTGSPDGMTVLMSGNEKEDSEINQNATDLMAIDNQELLPVLQKIKNRESGMQQVIIDDRLSYVSYSPMTITQWSIVVVVPLDDGSMMQPIGDLQGNIENNTQATIKNINARILQIIFMFVVVVILVAIVVTVLSNCFARRITEPIQHLTDGAKRVSGGDLDFKLSVQTGDELEILGETFNFMTVSLTEYIENLSRVTAEKERIGAELDVAARIQADMLPCIFPPFPNRTDFDIYATMTPAKEVGGDFYDFFLVDENHLALVMADVSGKGVPAALFMVISKTLIKNAAQTGFSPKEVLEKVNDQLCENNEAGLFVTVWLGILEISTGKMKCVNAGHEYPAIKRKGRDYELFKDKHGFVLAGMEGARYREYELDLETGDAIFVYTDGVAEATNAEQELYGTKRMLEALNRQKDVDCQELLALVRQDINVFVGEAPQFDDITMLCLEYRGIETEDVQILKPFD